MTENLYSNKLSSVKNSLISCHYRLMDVEPLEDPMDDLKSLAEELRRDTWAVKELLVSSTSTEGDQDRVLLAAMLVFSNRMETFISAVIEMRFKEVYIILNPEVTTCSEDKTETLLEKMGISA